MLFQMTTRERRTARRRPGLATPFVEGERIMERREMLGVVGAGAAGLWTAGAMGAVDDDKGKKDKKHEDHHGKDGHDHEHEHGRERGHDGGAHGADHAHMKIVGECAGVCNATMIHCVKELEKEDGKNREAHAKAVIYANDCQSFCGHHLELMARHSPLSRHATQACADACRDCAKVCDEGDDEVMKKCAQVCRDCEKACREHLEKCVKKG